MFQQINDPVGGSLALSALVAAIPLVTMFVLLGVFRVKAHLSALTGLAIALILAVVVWSMPVGQTLSAAAAGVTYGLTPILWILITALWIYRLSADTPWFETLGTTIRSISNDLRILAVLIAFCFGALLESLAGFGAPVAITAAMLIATGMNPIKAAVICLLANTAPVAFGSMGTPIIALNGVTGIELHELSSMAGRQTPLVAIIVPMLLVLLVDGKRGIKHTWPVALVAGFVFGLAQFLVSNYIAVELTDVLAAVATIIAVLAFLRVWQPKEIISSTEPTDADRIETGGIDGGGTGSSGTATAVTGAVVVKRPPLRHVLMAAAPYLVVIVIFSIAQIPAVKSALVGIGSTTFQWPGLDVVDADGNAVAAQKFKFDHLAATGTLLLLSGIITMGIYKISPMRGIRTFGATLVQLKWTIVTVTSVLALSFVMNLSGLTTSLGLALASTGAFFAVLSPIIGWLGVALTGSDTSSNSLFGAMQVTAADQTGLSATLMAASNSSAGVMGKMLSLQNLAVASAAVGVVGSESTLFRKLLPWSLGLLAVITALIVLQSTPVLGWMVP
ncbi:L-lactate permease [Rhodococcus sp. BP-252]|uniref:L-lactate permease n=1 Tax=Rhodococcoides kyotonense TaxID=398843 RepID=A0A177YH08_9NOCA|nr:MULTISPECIES: L-lactate permease [Rhodococcus]MBY6413151.1 L-lactate permease [Rhodococcus sp. BP-320]MBY6417686.1 L-lactate permease [Rhodococcus sp. BP-321]MBY6423290.1 L-lactate permease [Rhodococcus sp. BP-324]MBY6427893.1 L-lactate permease [Rhodococcus sp. BP-323]MBY6431892.1 L-lactate permease [Rhodococcus sp. BP-322]